MTDVSVNVLDELDTFARAMTAALRSVFPERDDALKVLALMESALSVGTRAGIGRLLGEAERLHLAPAAVRRQLLQRASTTLDRVVAANGAEFARLTANCRASRPEIKSLAERLHASL